VGTVIWSDRHWPLRADRGTRLGRPLEFQVPATVGAEVPSSPPSASIDLPIHESFLRSIASQDLKDLAIDVGQVTLESITDIEELKRLPVVGALAHVCGAIKSVRDRFNLKKILRFFRKVGDMQLEECEGFIQRMRADPRLAQQVTESFLVWLDRLDDEEKAELLARVFELYARRRIDLARSARFAAVIDRGHLPYLLKLGDNYLDDDLKSHFLALGLLRMTGKQSDVDHQKARDISSRNIELVKIELNSDGRQFKDYVIQQKAAGRPGRAP